MYVDRIGHLAANQDIFFRRLENNCFDKGSFLLIGPGKKGEHIVANKTLYEIVKNKVKNTPNVKLVDNFYIYNLLSFVSEDLLKYGINILLESHTNEVEFSLYERVLSFNKRQEYKGWSGVRKMGITEDTKVVCIFARDDAYLKSKDKGIDWSYHDYRNANIDTYIPSIKYLISRGYFVIRVGNIVSKRVDYHNKDFLDYPFSEFNSDFMDIFLIYISRFVIGTTSGATDIAATFNIPFLGVNYAPFTECPLGKGDRFIQKKMIDKSGKLVAYKDLFVLGVDDVYNGNDYLGRTGLAYVDNSDKEILDAVIEMESIVNNKYIERFGDSDLVDKYFSQYWTKNKNSTVKTPLCNSWLNSNKKLYL